MTDREAEIEHYQNSRDDEQEWGEAIVPKVRRRLDAVVSVRFKPEELERIREVAPDGNVSSFIRDATLKAIAPRVTHWVIEAPMNSSSSKDTSTVSGIFASTSLGARILSNEFEPPCVKLEVAS